MKPENILLDKDGHVVITDFGLSKQYTSPDSKAKTICGECDDASVTRRHARVRGAGGAGGTPIQPRGGLVVGGHVAVRDDRGLRRCVNWD